MIKKIYMMYAILCKGYSVIHIREDVGDGSLKWGCHPLPQDGYGGTSCSWAFADTPEDAAWLARAIK